MTNYEIVPLTIPPFNPQAAEKLEQWLESVSKQGSELVCIIPTQQSGSALAVFRSAQKGIVAANPAPGGLENE